MYWLASRAIMSVLPPAEYGTITVTGRSGHVEARERPVEPASASAAAPVSAARRETVWVAVRLETGGFCRMGSIHM
jgi:hypothetical protein